MKIDLTALLPDAAKPYAKYVYALLGVASLLVAQGVLDGKAADVVTAVVGLIVVPGAVYGAENRGPDGVSEVQAQDVHDEIDHDSDLPASVTP